jgi:hypothetical protein
MAFWLLAGVVIKQKRIINKLMPMIHGEVIIISLVTT